MTEQLVNAASEQLARSILRIAAAGVGHDRLIVAEVQELRRERSRTYLNADGTHTMIFHGKPLHYREAGRGPWLEIDPHWIPSTKPGFAWESRGLPYRLWVADNLRAEPFVEAEIRGKLRRFRLSSHVYKQRLGQQPAIVMPLPDVNLGPPQGPGWRKRHGEYTFRLEPDGIGFHIETTGPREPMTRHLVYLQEMVPLGPAATTVFYGQTSDGHIHGFHEDYATARATHNVCDNDDSYYYAGQYDDVTLIYVGANYLDFDTSALPDDMPVLSAALYVMLKEDCSEVDFKTHVYYCPWTEDLCGASVEANYDLRYFLGGGAVDEGEFVDSADGLTEGQYYSMAVGTSRINKTGDTKYSMVSLEDVNASQPSIETAENLWWYLANAPGTGSDPYLSVTYGIYVTIDAAAPGVGAQAPPARIPDQAVLAGAPGVGAMSPPVTVLLGRRGYSWGLGLAGMERPLSEADCEVTIQPRLICKETRTAGASLVRDVVAIKRIFRFAYSWLPARSSKVGLGSMGRDELWALYTLDSTLSLRVPREDAPLEEVPVRFRPGAWSDRLVYRGGPFGFVWALTFELEEV